LRQGPLRGDVAYHASNLGPVERRKRNDCMV
jgi:hypothetical protein